MFSSGLRPHGCMWEGWVCGGEGEGEGEGECPI